MAFTFQCSVCGKTHEGVPSFGAEAPWSYDRIPVDERNARGDLGSDDCIIDGTMFFVRGCIEIPVHGETDPLTWGVWVSLSEASHSQWIRSFDQERRSHIGPFFGWLNALLAPYPSTLNLKTRVHLRDHGLRPRVELEPTDHLLAVEQRNGISSARVADIYARVVHGEQPNASTTSI